MAPLVQRIGLTELFCPGRGQAVSVDIVFVHGLFGDPYRSWTYTATTIPPKSTVISESQSSRKRDRLSCLPLVSRFLRLGGHRSHPRAVNAATEEASLPSSERQDAPSDPTEETEKVFWPRDLLPTVLPQARVFTWGYDVDINHLFSPTSQLSVFRHAGSLLSDLADARTSAEDKGRPIIFIAHSLGGIIVKDALSQSRGERTHLSEILPATVGVCFLGTPHRGSDIASLGKIAFEISKAFSQKPAISVLRALEVNSETLDRIGRSFSQILVDGKIKIQSFREELPTKGVMIVDTCSYEIGHGLETLGNIPSDHRNMIKYASDQDVGFKRVTAVLLRWQDDIKQSPRYVAPSDPKPAEGLLPGQLTELSEVEAMEACLDSLNCRATRYRVVEVDKTFGTTYAWIFQGRVGFEDWLRDQQEGRIFWIRGKPGSGKSTLMKYALNHRMTLDLLNECDGGPWIVAGFFFHDRGELIQKSIEGLLCEMVYQVLSQRRDLLPLVLPIFRERPRCNQQEVDISKLDWSAQELGRALESIVNQCQVKLNVCFFIDALDEHVGNHRQLLKILQETVRPEGPSLARVKLCVASRPENIFLDAFHTCPGFAIHEFTADDIRQYAFGRMRSEMLVDLSSESKASFEGLIEEIVEGALGVFIWVKLVVDELIEGLCEGDTIEELRELLARIPSELEDLYRRAIVRVKGRRDAEHLRARYTFEAYVMFQIALHCRRSYSLQEFMNITSLTVTWSMDPAHFRWDEPRETLDLLRRRLSGRSGGLLETNTRSSDGEAGTVQFIHQTAKEFAQKDIATATLFPTVDERPQENGNIFMLRYCVRTISQGFDRAVGLVDYALQADHEMDKSYIAVLEELIYGFNDKALNNLDACFKRMLKHDAFQKLRFEHNCPQFWLLLFAAFLTLGYYLKEKSERISTLSQDCKGRLLIAAVHTVRNFRQWTMPDKKIVNLLIQNGVEVDYRFEGQTPLSILFQHEYDLAVYKDAVDLAEYKDAVDLLLSHKADPNQMVEQLPGIWAPPIVIAAKDNNWQSLVELLLRHGADPLKTDSEGKDAFFYAQEAGQSQIMEVLKRHQAKGREDR